MMRRVLAAMFVLVLCAGCASHSSYDTARLRQSDYSLGRLALTEGGLTAAQIRQIASTKRPTSFPVDLSTILVRMDYIDAQTEQLFMANVIQQAQHSEKVDRVVPVPDFLLPATLTYAAIQELGVRTLTEYVVVFVMDAESVFQWTKIVESEYEIRSEVDVFIVDSQTTAILASDKLFSTLRFKTEVFKREEEKQAKEEIFTEQGELLGKMIAGLFG